jgi:hypothetical protein
VKRRFGSRRFEAVQKPQQEGREISLLYAVSIHLSVLVALDLG